MNGSGPFKKRLRRHVVGRRREYFAVAAPGFEPVLLDEVKALVGGAAVESVPGGVGFEGQLVDCYRANLHLRTAGRVLLRIDAFRATRFDQLAARAGEIPWELFLPTDALPEVSVTARRCRLHHSDAIAERVTAAVGRRLEGAAGDQGITGEAGSFPQRLFVRGIEDRFTLSLDSSGDHLHKRGLKTGPGPAPIRETLAAAALMMAGYTGQEPLVDPMCGTGSFSLEGAFMAANLAPGLFRKFSFMGWPSFLPGRWDHLRREAASTRRGSEGPSVFASDLSRPACELLDRTIRRGGLSDVVEVAVRDFFDFAPSRLTREKGTLSLNPPYGRRLGTAHESNALFREICRKLLADYRGWRLALIAPRRDLAERVPVSGRPLSFQHGGERRWLMTGRVL